MNKKTENTMKKVKEEQTEKQAKKNIVTFDMIMAKKGLIASSPVPFYSTLFEGDIVVENTHADAFAATMSAKEEDEMYGYSRLIYENCPVFRNPKLLEEYETDDPYIIPQLIYGSQVVEFLRLGNYILSVYGLNTEKIQDTKKQ